ncbi:hypothetical protein HK405_007561, partial [Cladochytrium tenue]
YIAHCRCVFAFDSHFVEARDEETGELIQVVPGVGMRLLHAAPEAIFLAKDRDADSQELRPRFTEPYDDFLETLLDILATCGASVTPEAKDRAFSMAPRGSKWTIWISQGLKDRFHTAKATHAAGATHGEFVELMMQLRAEQLGIPGGSASGSGSGPNSADITVGKQPKKSGLASSAALSRKPPASTANLAPSGNAAITDLFAAYRHHPNKEDTPSYSTIAPADVPRDAHGASLSEDFLPPSYDHLLHHMAYTEGPSATHPMNIDSSAENLSILTPIPLSPAQAASNDSRSLYIYSDSTGNNEGTKLSRTTFPPFEASLDAILPAPSTSGLSSLAALGSEETPVVVRAIAADDNTGHSHRSDEVVAADPLPPYLGASPSYTAGFDFFNMDVATLKSQMRLDEGSDNDPSSSLLCRMDGPVNTRAREGDADGVAEEVSSGLEPDWDSYLTSMDTYSAHSLHFIPQPPDDSFGALFGDDEILPAASGLTAEMDTLSLTDRTARATSRRSSSISSSANLLPLVDLPPPYNPSFTDGAVLQSNENEPRPNDPGHVEDDTPHFEALLQSVSKTEKDFENFELLSDTESVNEAPGLFGDAETFSTDEGGSVDDLDGLPPYLTSPGSDYRLALEKKVKSDDLPNEDPFSDRFSSLGQFFPTVSDFTRDESKGFAGVAAEVPPTSTWDPVALLGCTTPAMSEWMADTLETPRSSRDPGPLRRRLRSSRGSHSKPNPMPKSDDDVGSGDDFLVASRSLARRNRASPYPQHYPPDNLVQVGKARVHSPAVRLSSAATAGAALAQRLPPSRPADRLRRGGTPSPASAASAESARAAAEDASIEVRLAGFDLQDPADDDELRDLQTRLKRALLAYSLRRLQERTAYAPGDSASVTTAVSVNPLALAPTQRDAATRTGPPA